MLRSLLLLLAIVAGSSFAGGTESDGNQRLLQLQTVCRDDFALDSRSQYRVRGNIGWQPGELTLEREAELTRTLDAGAWVEAELELHFPTTTPASLAAETTLRFQFDRAGAAQVLWRTRTVREQQHPLELLVLAADPRGKDRPPRVVRRWQLAGTVAGKWTVTYRQGVIRVLRPPVTGKADGAKGELEGTRFYASLDKGSARPVALSLVQGTAGRLRVQALSIAAAARQAPRTDEQAAAAERGAALADQVKQLFRGGQVGQALETAKQAYQLRKLAWGDEHPDSLRSLNNLAFLYTTVGDGARAEPLYITVRDLRKKVLGVMHPDYANSLNNLGVLYVAMGEFARAEPLHLEARSIRRQVVGEAHPEFGAGQPLESQRRGDPRFDGGILSKPVG